MIIAIILFSQYTSLLLCDVPCLIVSAQISNNFLNNYSTSNTSHLKLVETYTY